MAKPYRAIVEWVRREVKEFPPDPEEPQHGLDAETWSKIRHETPHASAHWLVKLACGHHCHVVTNVDWKPEDGPRLVSAERREEMTRDFHEHWASQEGKTGWPAEGPQHDHVRKMLALRWPRPEPEQECFACTSASKITGYQRIGWLVPRPRPPAPAPTEREQIQAQLERAEAEVARLQGKLEENKT